MKRILVMALLMVPILMPAQAQTVESVRVPFAILVPTELMAIDGARCTLLDDHFPKLDAFPTPYAAPVGDWTLSPRVVNETQSPVPGLAGCLWEVSLELESGFDYQMQISHSQGWWAIDAGSLTFGELIAFGPDTIVFILDQEAFNIGMTSALRSEQSEVPDYPATIEAQEQEIESLRATIEALEAPDP